MTLKAGAILMTTVMIACFFLGYYFTQRNFVPHNSDPTTHMRVPSRTNNSEHLGPDLKGKYKVEEQKGDCPVCQEEGIDVVKPFTCDHTMCEECLDRWAKSRSGNRHYEIIDGWVTSVEDTANCTLCRAELKEPPQ